MYKMIPRQTYNFQGSEAKGFKPNKERVSVMCCSNRTGNHRVKLCVVGKSAKPRCLKDIKQIPVNKFITFCVQFVPYIFLSLTSLYYFCV